ncbi:MAG: DUF4860 domain-containing protein [Defluviitaleaceae bacterium]|nr:DUF4860 domain-containing protein [Defluviitaleaceae bacterium]
MKKVLSTYNKIDTVFVLMIFCVFAVSVFLVLMLSGSVYRNMTDISTHGQNERIMLSYIRTMVRNNDTAESISVRHFNEISALAIEENIGGRIFVTYIYLYDGWARELFHESIHDFGPSAGIPLIRTDLLYFEEVESNLIRVSTNYGSMLISPRSVSSIESGGF